jgi:hypothetical protein
MLGAAARAAFHPRQSVKCVRIGFALSRAQHRAVQHSPHRLRPEAGISPTLARFQTPAFALNPLTYPESESASVRMQKLAFHYYEKACIFGT